MDAGGRFNPVFQGFSPGWSRAMNFSESLCRVALFRSGIEHPILMRGMISVGTVFVLCLLVCGTTAADQIRDLSDGQQATIHGLSAALFTLGGLANQYDRDTAIATTYRPNRLDSWFRTKLRGAGERPTNFLDDSFGARLIPLTALCVLGVLDIDRREFSRDIPFFLAGQAATAGITGTAKSLFSRPRPYMLDDDRARNPDREHYRSFFSGHTSAAFYAMTFLNLRVRSHMRQHWTEDEYRIGRWLSPVISYGWASYVGYSRMQADKHFFTDVAIAALAGTLIAEIYYHLAYETSGGIKPTKPALSIAISFPL